MYISEKFSKMIIEANYDSISNEVRENAKMILLDYLGNLIGSKIADTSEMAVRLAEELGGDPECTILGSPKKVSAMNAVLANAMGGYSFDFVDDHNDSQAHPSPATIPTALSLGEKYGLSGKKFMEAYIVGNEVIARAGSAYLGDMNQQCFHPSAVLGTMGAVATAGKSMGLSMNQLVNAQGIGITSMAGGLYAWNSKSNTSKRVNAAQPARNGILAAMMAEKGITGPVDVYEGRYGAFNAFGYQKNWNADQAVRNLGKEWQFSNSSIKPYPACRYCGGNIDACLKIVNRYPIDINQIEAIIYATQKPQIDNIMLPVEEKMHPKNMVEMQHSLPYCGAMALIKKRFTVEELQVDNLNNPDVQRLMRLTSYRVDPKLDARYPESYSTSVIVKMKDGSEYKGIIDYPLGDWRNPVDSDFIIEKFRKLASNGIKDTKRIQNIIDYVLNIEEQSNVSNLLEMMNFYNS